MNKKTGRVYECGCEIYYIIGGNEVEIYPCQPQHLKILLEKCHPNASITVNCELLDAEALSVFMGKSLKGSATNFNPGEGKYSHYFKPDTKQQPENIMRTLTPLKHDDKAKNMMPF